MTRMAMLLVMAAGALACKTERPTPTDKQPPPVRVDGALMAIFHHDDRSAQVQLRDVISPTTVAVGALADLAGEVTMERGRTWIARPGDAGPRYAGAAGSADAACLLVSARVAAWRKITLERELDLEAAGVDRQAIPRQRPLAPAGQRSSVRAPFSCC